MDDEALAFESPAAWEAWLSEHHESSDGIWIKFAKKASGIPSVTYKEVLPIALAHGWIDGQVKRIDEDWYRQRWTPRRARSTSRIPAGFISPRSIIASAAARLIFDHTERARRG